MTTPPAFCLHCGTRRLPDARFCGGCGADLGGGVPVPAHPDQAVPTPGLATEPTIVPASGPARDVDRHAAPEPAPPIAVAPVSAPYTPPVPARRRRSRTPLLLGGLLLVLVVGLGGALWLLFRPAGPAGSTALPDASHFPEPDGASRAPLSAQTPLQWRWEVRFADPSVSANQVSAVLVRLGDPTAYVLDLGNGSVLLKSSTGFGEQPVIASALEDQLGPISEAQEPVRCEGTGGDGAGAALRVTYLVPPTDGRVPTAEGLRVVKEIMLYRLRSACAPGSTATVVGSDRIVVELPDISDSAHVRRLLSETGMLHFVPLGSTQVQAGQILDLNQYPPLFGGDQVSSATIGTDQNGRPAVDFVLSGDGARAFADYTAANLGSYFAITLDWTPISVSRVDSDQAAGTDRIRLAGGALTSAEMWDVVVIVRHGALPYPVQEIALEGVSP